MDFSGYWEEVETYQAASTGSSSLFGDGTEKRNPYLAHR